MKIETKESLIFRRISCVHTVFLLMLLSPILTSVLQIHSTNQKESVATRAAKAVPAIARSVAPVL